MERIAKLFSWLGMVAALFILIQTVVSTFQVGLSFSNYETLVVVLPLGLALLALSKRANRALVLLALVFNTLLIALSVSVLLGELAWHMLGARIVTLVVFFALTPSVLNCIALYRRKNAKAQPAS